MLLSVFELCKAYIDILNFGKSLPREKISGDFTNSNLLACFLSVTLPLAYYVSITFLKKKIFGKMLFACYAVLVLILFIILQSRGALLSIIVGVIFILPTLKRTILLVLVSLLLLLSIALLYLKYNSVLGRLLIWKITLLHSFDSFFIGHGTGSFNYLYPSLQANYFMQNKVSEQTVRLADIPQVPFNEFINFFFENGFIGLMIFCGVVYIALKIRGTGENHLPVFLKAALIIILINSFFSYPFHATLLLMILFFIIAALSSFIRTRVITTNQIVSKLISVLICVACSFVLMYLYKEQDAVRQWRNASFVFTEDEDAENIMRNSFPVLKNRGQFLYNYGSLYIEKGKIEEGLQLLEKARDNYNQYDLYLLLGYTYEKLNNLKKAEEYFTYASYMIPNRFAPKYHLVKVYISEGKIEEAKQLANEIMSMPIKIPSAKINFIKQKAQDFIINNIK